MLVESQRTRTINQRVRAILLTEDGDVLLIKRVKPRDLAPYWVAPGGGLEPSDIDLVAALQRELVEELGADALVLETAFVLEHEKAGKQLEEHFFICLLRQYDVSKRHGPEFDDPARGEYIPDAVPLSAWALSRIHFKTPELQDWMIRRLDYLRRFLPATVHVS